MSDAWCRALDGDAARRDLAVREAAEFCKGSVARLVYDELQRWEEMAEDLWEELQLWHADTCAKHRMDPRIIGKDCTCHHLLAVKWDLLTHATEYADETET
jgi:hypothetical protein